MEERDLSRNRYQHLGRWARVGAALAALLASRAARADEGLTPACGTEAELEARGAKIGRIILHPSDIFDESKPGERFALFRLANRLHPTTREQVIRRLLLVEPGDLYSARRVAESERILRATRYFYDAHIEPVACNGDAVDLEVDTRDVWSLNAGVRFRRGGGTNSLSFQVQDTNFLGFGKELATFWERTVDRTTSLFRYRDERLLGRHLRLQVEHADSTDGRSQLLELERPFFSLDTRWSAGFDGSSIERTDSRYRLGHIYDRFHEKVGAVDLFGGWAPARHGAATQRFLAGFSYEDHAFQPLAASSGHPATGDLPPDRTLAYPWIGWQWSEDGFVVTHDLDKIQRSEDLNLGGEATVKIGWSATGLGASEEGWVCAASWTDGWRLGERHLLTTAASLGGRVGGGAPRGVQASLSVRDFITDFGRHRLLLGLRLDASHRADPETQLLLGGDSGLRGYPLRYEEGDRRVLLTVEQRLYSDRELFHLVHLGAAVFFDAGRAWFADASHAPSSSPAIDPGWLADVGVGLRLGSSRSARAAMVHLDLAFPLRGPKDLAHAQWLVMTSEKF